MSETPRSPKVLEISWGRMEIEGLGIGKDFKLYPGGGRPWDWSETGTRHVPGIQPADVEELLDRGATTVVLSLGLDQVLQVDPRTLDWCIRLVKENPPWRLSVQQHKLWRVR